MKRFLLAVVAALVLPACADRGGDDMITELPAQPAVQVPAQLLNVMHDGHLYVIVLFTQGGAILHSPACPAERVR